ncbi:hypothetical protein KIL84_011517 [Mauremys mutica]|uniref:Uncharacterized protein n=1 Tax=Mauremys mutica TaxID=74926 RepID=A0A9D3XEY9_9SAUR|nr:hypothetical protein KIL84_011517 [Mauremys mutica]
MIGGVRKMKRIYLSGVEKRKQKKARQMQEEKGKITLHKFLHAQSKSSQLTELSDADIQGFSAVGSESGVVREKEKVVCEESKILPHSEINVMVVVEEEKEIQPLFG